MKINLTLLFLLVSVLFLSAQTSKTELVAELVADAFNIESSKLDATLPIYSFNKMAKEKADKKMVLTKDNIEEALKVAKEYKAVYITVVNYTVVKITDFDDCRASGAWSALMPLGKGYVQKAGKLTLKNDYINNIIGLPNNQARMIYMFK